jgi:hypothetical protein
LGILVKAQGGLFYGQLNSIQLLTPCELIRSLISCHPFTKDSQRKLKADAFALGQKSMTRLAV